MKKTKKTFLGIALAMCIAPSTALAEGQTIESAHGFLSSVINKGSTQIYGYSNDDIEAYKGSDCDSEFTLVHQKKKYSMYIDWSAISEVKNHGTRVDVSGAIRGNRYGNQSITQNVGIVADSETMADRMLKAFEFLRVKCDKTQKYGF